MSFSGRIRFCSADQIRDIVEETESGAASPRATTILNTNFSEVMTLDVAPAASWVADDVITGQTSGATCTAVARLTATTYAVKDRVGTYTLGEIVGVTGTGTKLADQGATRPIFTSKDREGVITYTYDALSVAKDEHAITISAYTAPSTPFVP